MWLGEWVSEWVGDSFSAFVLYLFWLLFPSSKGEAFPRETQRGPCRTFKSRALQQYPVLYRLWSRVHFPAHYCQRSMFIYIFIGVSKYMFVHACLYFCFNGTLHMVVHICIQACQCNSMLDIHFMSPHPIANSLYCRPSPPTFSLLLRLLHGLLLMLGCWSLRLWVDRISESSWPTPEGCAMPWFLAPEMETGVDVRSRAIRVLWFIPKMLKESHSRLYCTVRCVHDRTAVMGRTWRA